MEPDKNGVKICQSDQHMPLLECFSKKKASLAARRISKLTGHGKHLFRLYAASRPFPFFPKTVTVTRNYLKASTRNNTKYGSIYNNWSLPTLFKERDRRTILSISDVLNKLSLSGYEFSSICCAYYQKYCLSGVPTDLSTGSGGNAIIMTPHLLINLGIKYEVCKAC